jgi:UDP-N-acetylglucosamine--N-acetylmuramyl-(pentapeptide) pyrophosphoryl-undecaprenol N-acetylglucosamine transferase
MPNDTNYTALLVADGSGGHLIPALETARALARAGHRTHVWYVQRRRTGLLIEGLRARLDARWITMEPMPMGSGTAARWPLGRAIQSAWLWGWAWHQLGRIRPRVVVGFGGWISVPVLVAAKARNLATAIHEQNVVMGRANRWLSSQVDRVFVAFRDTRGPSGDRPVMWTGLPIREEIGQSARKASADRFGFDTDRPTLLVLGGSQGARAINRLMTELTPHLSSEERRSWQILHLTGQEDRATTDTAYAQRLVTHSVSPFLLDMESAYALADVAIARAGASTVAELARCGIPTIFIPYPHAHGHQRENARVAESAGGAFVMEESSATPERLISLLRQMLGGDADRKAMAARIAGLQQQDASDRLAEAILGVAAG